MLETEPFEPPDPEEFTDESPDPETDPTMAALADAYAQHGITQVVVHYDGCGDSGCISGVEYLPEGVSLPPWIEKSLLDIAENYCPDGYENNDGGYGTLTLYPQLGLARLDHRDYYEESVEMDATSAGLPVDLQQRLLQLKVSQLTAEFDGYGDSGQINDITTEPDGIHLDNELRAALDDFLWNQLPEGFENNEGGYGTFTVDVATGEIVIDAYWREAKDSDSKITAWRWRN